MQARDYIGCRVKGADPYHHPPGYCSGEPLKEDTKITINFDDSIIEDKEAERQSDRQDVAMGAMGIDEYRAKYYSEILEKARANLPVQNTVME